ncbi:MAG: SdpI family protein [Candidatus Limivicinus sp.]|jgi:uncharacterized membrane protein
MNDFIKAHKWEAVLSSALILLPVPAGLILRRQLSSAAVWSHRGEYVFLLVLPLVLLALHWICLSLTFADKRNREQSGKVISLLFWIMPAASLLICGIMWCTALQGEINFKNILSIVLGLIFIIAGNYMPKIRQNSAVGIKTGRALGSKENWYKTHRFAGKLWTLGGFALLALLLLPEGVFMPVLITVLVLLAFLPVLYSDIYYSRHREEDSPRPHRTHAGLIWTAAVLAAALVLVTLFTGSIKFETGDSSLRVRASYYPDITVDYDDMDSIEYREEFEPGARFNGFGSPRLSMGSYRNSEFGSYTLYSCTGAEACIVISSGGDILVLGAETGEETRALYDTLLEKTGLNCGRYCHTGFADSLYRREKIL